MCKSSAEITSDADVTLMYMNLNFEHEDGPVKRAFEPKSSTRQDWLENTSVQNILGQFPQLRDSIERALRSEVLLGAIRRTREYSDALLAQTLEADLQEAFQGLEGGAPKTVRDLSARDATLKDPAGVWRSDEEIRRTSKEQRTGGGADYLAQRLTAVLGLIDLFSGKTPPAPLDALLNREADRIATLFVAFQRADLELPEDSEAVAAK